MPDRSHHIGVQFLRSAPATSFLDAFKHPGIISLLAYTDKVLFIINNTSLKIELASENCHHLFGLPRDHFEACGLDTLMATIHPEDMRFLQRVVFPSHERWLQQLQSHEITKAKLEYTCRIEQKNGGYVNALQQGMTVVDTNGDQNSIMSIWTNIDEFKKDKQVWYRSELVDESGTRTLPESSQPKAIFTKAELRILRFTALGYSEKEIAARAGLSINTVKTHRKKMLKKSGARNAAELMHYSTIHLILS